MTAHATVESAIEAMKLGALDYLQKPFEIDELLVVVNRALDHQRLRTQHGYLLSERDEEFNQYGIVGRSRRVQDVIRTAQMVAKSKSTVLITGETGTGKEMVARAIHFHSAQREMPLVKVNCAAIPENLLESELFGHVRGAFTGALTNKKGKFALADGGTHLPRRDRDDGAAAAVQAAARAAGARVRAARIGAQPQGRRPRDRRDQPRHPADGVRRTVPGRSLLPAERHPDPHSAAARAARRHPAAGRSLRAQARAARRQAHRRHRGRACCDALQAADWPGNVRELENTVERAVVLSPGAMIGADVVRLLGVRVGAGRGTAVDARCAQNLDWAERETVRRALEAANGVKKDAAEAMGISQRALSYYLAKHRIE